MENNREQIIKALECCTTIGGCDNCPFTNKASCGLNLRRDALALIKELIQAHETLSESYDHLEKTKDEFCARIDKWMSLVFEEAKIRAKHEYDRRCVECNYNYTEADMSKLIAEAKSETIIKMRSLIKERCIAGGIYPAFVASTIEKVAKELLGGD